MREIERTSQFRRDYKREAKGRHRASLADDLTTALRMLVCDRPLPVRYRDHALGGEWQGFRDCHVKPDLLPIYEKPDAETLRLVRLGSHSELGF
jgi:mRNA interferase YafQ